MRRNLKRFVSDTRWQHHRNGSILAPLPIAPVHEADTVLLPKGLKALKRISKQTGVSFKGAYLNLDGGFDSASNRKAIFKAGVIPNVKENPRNRTALSTTATPWRFASP